MSNPLIPKTEDTDLCVICGGTKDMIHRKGAGELYCCILCEKVGKGELTKEQADALRN